MSVHLSELLGPGLGQTGPMRHLIVPWALGAPRPLMLALLDLPPEATANLRQLLRRMRICKREVGEAASLSPPHERALADLLGWQQQPDGLLPWAARHASEPGAQAWAWVSLCHWSMGREHASLSDPQSLHISEQESGDLLRTMRPYFESEGIALQAARPGHWLGRGEIFNQATASLDRVIARNVDPWLPSGPSARLLRRLQNEMQMLLYTHPVNQARAERGEPAINSLWFSGSGRLPAQHKAPPGLHMTRLLAAPALGEDAQAYAQAWAQLDAQLIAPMLEQQRQGLAVELTLCGERSWLRLQSITAGWLGRLVNSMSAPAWPQLLQDKP